MNDTAIVTCFYTNLHGTSYGGRSGKESQYLHSLRSLLKITNADFYIYCAPTQTQLVLDVVQERSNVHVIPFDLEDFYMRDLFIQYKDLDEAKQSQRCQEIQYLKTWWMKQVLEQHHYQWAYWIDIGISYSNLIPNKHLSNEENEKRWYDSDLFVNDLVSGMKNYSADKLMLLCINNNVPSFYRQCLLPFYGRFQDQIFYHVIAGIFGGKKANVLEFHDDFTRLAPEVCAIMNTVHDEECLYNILWDRHPEKYAAQLFETWWHEDNAASHNPDDPTWVDYITSLRAFYNVLEDLVELGRSNDQEEARH